MNLLDRFKLNLARGLRKAATNLTFLPVWARWSVLPGLIRVLIQRGYKANSAVFACISALAFGFSEPRLEVYKEEEDLTLTVLLKSPLRKLLKRPNRSMSLVEFLQYVVVYAALGGNVYIWKERNSTGEVIGLWPFSDLNITPIASNNTKKGLVDYYELNSDDTEKVKIQPKDIIQWKWMVDPEKPWLGYGGLEAAWADIASDNEGSEYLYSLLKNNAIPPIVVTLVQGDELTEEKANRLKKQWIQNYGGKNSGVPAFLEAGMTAQKLGQNMEELAFDVMRNVPETRICAAFRVPPIIAGVNAGLKRSDYGDKAARKGFTEDILASLWRSFEAELESGLENEFSDEFILRFDLSKVRALQDDTTQIWTRVTRAWQSGLVKRSTGKRILGIPVIPEEDDVYFTDFYALQDPNARGNDGAQRDDPDDTDDGKNKKSGRKTLSREEIDIVMDRLRVKRESLIGVMSSEVDLFFEALASDVVQRYEDGSKAAGAKKVLVEDLLTDDDFLALDEVNKRYVLSLMKISWADWNLLLDSTLSFSTTDPAVTRALSGAGESIMDIKQTTIDAVRELLQKANDEGLTIDEISNQLRSVVEETYQGRAENIARWELGVAQNSASLERYEGTGVSQVMVLDNGFENSNENCKWIDGQIRDLDWCSKDHPGEGPSGIKNPLQHPRCVRAYAPYFD